MATVKFEVKQRAGSGKITIEEAAKQQAERLRELASAATADQIVKYGRGPEQALPDRGDPPGPFIGPLQPGQVPGQREAPSIPPYEEQETRVKARPPYWTGVQMPPPGLIPGGVMRAGVPCFQRAPESNQGMCRFDDLDSLPDSVIAVLKNERHRNVEGLEELEDLVQFVEARLVPIPGDVATTKHSYECMKAQPALVRALRMWKMLADLACADKFLKGEKPSGNNRYPILGLLYITSCYRRLGTTCDFDTYGKGDAWDPSGHWAGYAVDVTLEGLRNYFGNTYDPRLTETEINTAASGAGLVRDRKHEGKLEFHHWRVLDEIPRRSVGPRPPAAQRKKDTSLPWPYGPRR